MPNTLVHLGVQGVASRVAVRDVDFKWVALGCVIPDVPWILRRVIGVVAPDVNPYDLMLYATAQASLAISLLLCGALACVSQKPRLVFGVLVANSLLHLVLDAAEIKWGNGVHLLAPFSWQLLSFESVWPNSPPIYFLTAFGLVFSSWMLYKPEPRPIGLSFQSITRAAVGIVLLLAYFMAPFTLLEGPEKTDHLSAKTLREKQARPGREVLIDRWAYYRRGESLYVTRSYAGEEINIVGDLPMAGGNISVRGRFSDQSTIIADETHFHKAGMRDGASAIGLAIVLLFWLKAFIGRRRTVAQEE